MRENYLDISKGIGIILVVMMHSGMIPSPLSIFINAFYMPMFFIISGYLLGKKNKLRDFSSTKIVTSKLAKEYGMACVMLFISRFMVLKVLFNERLQLKKSLISTLYGRFYGVTDKYIGDVYGSGHLWFLTAMIVSILFVFLYQKIKKYNLYSLIAMLIAMLIFAELLRYIPDFMPWCTDISIVISFIMVIGYELGVRDLLNRKICCHSCILNVAMMIIFVSLMDSYDIHMRNYGKYESIFGVIAVIVTGVSGSIIFIRICRLIEKISVIKLVNNIFAYLGKNSIAIFVWHIFFIYIFEMIMGNDINKSKLTSQIAFLILVIVCSLIFNITLRYLGLNTLKFLNTKMHKKIH